MLRGSTRFAKLFASFAALSLLTVPLTACDDGGPDEIFEEIGDEIDDATDELE